MKTRYCFTCLAVVFLQEGSAAASGALCEVAPLDLPDFEALKRIKTRRTTVTFGVLSPLQLPGLKGD